MDNKELERKLDTIVKQNETTMNFYLERSSCDSRPQNFTASETLKPFLENLVKKANKPPETDVVIQQERTPSPLDKYSSLEWQDSPPQAINPAAIPILFVSVLLVAAIIAVYG